MTTPKKWFSQNDVATILVACICMLVSAPLFFSHYHGMENNLKRIQPVDVLMLPQGIVYEVKGNPIKQPNIVIHAATFEREGKLHWICFKTDDWEEFLTEGFRFKITRDFENHPIIVPMP